MFRCTRIIIVLLLLCSTGYVRGQQPFLEGELVYHVTLTSPEGVSYKGVYTMSFKGAMLRKELKLQNGFEDVTLFNFRDNSVYTLQQRKDKKYAIQLSYDEMLRKQAPFLNFSVKKEKPHGKKKAGWHAYNATIRYRNGHTTDIVYTKDWKPSADAVFNRFPGAPFIPLWFSYHEDNGLSMVFDACELEPNPVPSALFRIPEDYKMISYEEYKRINNDEDKK